MILIGDENIPYETIEKIETIKDIETTKSNSTVLFNFDIDTLKYTQANDIRCIVKVTTIQELIYASNLGASYIMPESKILKSSQKLADNYMFDSKILAIIDNENQIEQMALDEIDGIIYKHLI